MTIEVPKYDFLTSHEVIFIENTKEKPYFLKNRKIIVWTHFASLLLPHGPFRGHLGLCLDHLGASWAPFGASWGYLLAISGDKCDSKCQK